MTKVYKLITNPFKRIPKDHVNNKINDIQMICTSGNTLFNLQQISSKQAVHIALSLQLTRNSRQYIFINTSHMEEQTFIIKPPLLLKQEPNDYEDVMYHSIIDYHIQHPLSINHICLIEFVFKYTKNGVHISKRKKPKVICFIQYKKHIDYENYCREKILLYVPFENNEIRLKHNLPTWKDS